VDGPGQAENNAIVQELTVIKQKVMDEIDEIIKKHEKF
jgi:hypothetical protein